MRFSTVLFDLDGTLIDSGAMILSSFRHATRSVLRREIPDEQLLAAVGGSNLLEQMRALDELRVDELVTAYREHNEPLHSELQACAGVLDVVAELGRQGRRLGIVTAKRHATVELAFAVLPPLREPFEVVVGSEDTERHKPNPEPILHALEHLGVGAGTAAYVGDSPFDIGAARAAGVHAVAVTWGGIHTRERLEQERPDAVVDRPEELLAVL
ncbi:MAG: HAD-IA family hydrolase [Actinobacteria bacterium]|nr:HAD-IA family hydrolase [Actinomycetota bacterium]